MPSSTLDLPPVSPEDAFDLDVREVLDNPASGPVAEARAVTFLECPTDLCLTHHCGPTGIG